MFFNSSSHRTKLQYSGQGVVDRVIRQDELCRIKFGGTYWSARTLSPFALQPGDCVWVVARQQGELLIKELQ